MTRDAGLVLAAGAGRRFGGPKALIEIAGERLVDRAVQTLRAGGVERVYVVAGAVVVDNPDWAEGIGSSLRIGLAALPTEVDGALVVLVDQPGLTSQAVARVLGHPGGRKAVVVATYDGQPRHPVLLGRDHWREVSRRAVGDHGARPFLAAHPDLVHPVECADIADSADVDTRDDLLRFIARET